MALEFGHAAMQCTAIAEDSVLPETNLSKRDGRSLLSLRSPRSIYKTVYFFQEFETIYVISLTDDEETRFFESSKSVLGAFKIGACVRACIRELSSN